MFLPLAKTKFFLALVLTLSWCQLESKEAPIKIGYVDIDLIFSSLPEAKSIESQCKTYMKQLQKELQKEEEEVRKAIQVSQAEEAKMTEAEKEKRTVELAELIEGIKKIEAESQKKLAKKQESLIRPVYEKIQNTIKQIAQQQGYTHVLNGSINNIPLLLYVDEKHNLSDRILKQLGNKPKQGKKK